MVRRAKSPEKADALTDAFERQMAIARQVMERDWVALRALALGDQYPELDVESLIKMAKEQGRGRSASKK